MSEDKIHTIFISSTIDDLVEERRLAKEIITAFDCKPIMQELFAPAGLPTWDVIEKHLKESDYYILIMGNRYGTKDKNTGIGFTEQEYDYAKKNKIPMFTLYTEYSEKYNEYQEEQKNFRDKLDKKIFNKRCNSRADFVKELVVGLLELKPKSSPEPAYLETNNFIDLINTSKEIIEDNFSIGTHWEKIRRKNVYVFVYNYRLKVKYKILNDEPFSTAWSEALFKNETNKPVLITVLWDNTILFDFTILQIGQYNGFVAIPKKDYFGKIYFDRVEASVADRLSNDFYGLSTYNNEKMILDYYKESATKNEE